MHVLLLLFALAGHAFLWIGLVNRLHAVGIRRWIIKITTIGFVLCAALIPIGVGWWCIRNLERSVALPWEFAFDVGDAGIPVSTYLVVCWVVLSVTLLRLVYWRWLRLPPSIVRYHERRRVEIDPASAAANAQELAHHPLTRLPCNEILQLAVSQWALDMPRLTPALEGLSIVHLSDLHFTGRVGKAYFREVVRVSNSLRPDLVCITGDIMDKTICLGWIADTLGQLASRHGVYFILGNHDRRVDDVLLRHTLEQSGLVDVGGRWLQIDLDGTPVMLAGNERPWFDERGTHSCPPPDGSLRIVLAHSPDQFAWARANDADLMLAGHTHGGQIRIPPLGAICSPTWHGVKYISGIFHAPPTILHVTRGVSGDIPVRWNCRPEIALLKLRVGG